MNATRRQWLQAGLGSSLVALSPGAPWLLRAVAAEASRAAGRVLVVLQLTGGNDGLNTVIPHADENYRRNRFTLAVPREQVRKIDADLGFHPALEGFARLLEGGQLCVVNGVGYPRPNRSHFESMDIWHTARREVDARPTGWLGRWLDAAGRPDGLPLGRDVPALHLGGEKQPLALAAQRVQVPSARRADGFRLDAESRSELMRAIDAATAARRETGNDLLSFVHDSAAAALASSRRVSEALGNYRASVVYPANELAQKLRTVAQLIDAGLGTRVYYVTLDGFDTHSTQAPAHAGLLNQLGGALAALLDDLTQRGHHDRVLVMAFSEFGRRVKENASQGTDHGAAAPLFLAGGRVRAGVVGAYPSLTDLDDGDLKHHTDFRQVYATVLEQWLGAPSHDLLGGEYAPLPLLRG